jgi:hypothetical protein
MIWGTVYRSRRAGQLGGTGDARAEPGKRGSVDAPYAVIREDYPTPRLIGQSDRSCRV